MMNQNNIFVDTNVLIGAWAGRPNDVLCLQYLFSLKGKKLFSSTLSIAQFISVYHKKRTNDEIRKQVKYLQTKFNLISFTEKDVNKAVDEASPDLEDNLQYVLCRKMNCLHFITNNTKDYSGYFLLNVLKPNQSRQINQ